MFNTCSLHCGFFTGVDDAAFKKQQKKLEEMFNYVNYDPESGTLEMTGARDIEDSPVELTGIFDMLSTLLAEGDGRGRIMAQCQVHEVCYFRRHMWKLMAIEIPADPFDDIHHVG